MEENNRRKLHNNIESVRTGFANGQAEGAPFTEKKNQKLLKKLLNIMVNF